MLYSDIFAVNMHKLTYYIMQEPFYVFNLLVILLKHHELQYTILDFCNLLIFGLFFVTFTDF